MGCSFYSVANTEQFQEEMYRPLYWFGLAASSSYVPSLSLGNTPKFSNGNKKITIDMKGWKFADGQTVDGQSVMFFLNMYKADPASFCGYNGGFGIPDQVSSASATGNTVNHELHDLGQPGLDSLQLPLGNNPTAELVGPNVRDGQVHLRHRRLRLGQG